MSRFAAYEPGRRRAAPPVDAGCVRAARPDDLDPLAALGAERRGLAQEAVRAYLALDLEAMGAGGPAYVVVGEVDGALAGYARVRHLLHARDDLPAALPEGWYLAGLVVAPAVRRRGLGRALTASRLAWLGGRADAVHYVCRATNRTSLDLHAAFGFTECARDFDYPQAGLAAGHGLAFRLVLDADS